MIGSGVGVVDRRAVLRRLALGSVAALMPGGAGHLAAAPTWSRGVVAAACGLEALAANLHLSAGNGLRDLRSAASVSPPVAVLGSGWRPVAAAVAADSVALGLVLRAADDPAPWPGGAGLEAAAVPLAAPLVLWSTVPVASDAAFQGLAIGVDGVGGLGLAQLGLRPLGIASQTLASALRAGAIAAAVPPPGADPIALGLHRTAPYLLVADEPPPPMRLSWLMAPGVAAALAPTDRRALDAVLHHHLATALGGIGGPARVPTTTAAVMRGLRRAALPPVIVRAHADALRNLADPVSGGV